MAITVVFAAYAFGPLLAGFGFAHVARTERGGRQRQVLLALNLLSLAATAAIIGYLVHWSSRNVDEFGFASLGIVLCSSALVLNGLAATWLWRVRPSTDPDAAD